MRYFNEKILKQSTIKGLTNGEIFTSIPAIAGMDGGVTIAIKHIFLLITPPQSFYAHDGFLPSVEKKRHSQHCRTIFDQFSDIE